MKPTLVFDMDGVLVEVTESYREAIVQTVRHFTGRTVEREVIQEYKNQGGWNNDWLLSQRLCRDFGVQVDYPVVVDYFCRIFFGEDKDGLITRETWIPSDGLLDRLAARFDLAIFTGRLQQEVAITLRRFVPNVNFDPVIAADDVEQPKPAPDGLNLIKSRRRGATFIYVGDTVDDARSSSAAGVPFIGIAAPSNPKHHELAALLRQEGAFAVLDDINQIEGVLPA
jgi:HAD superfamily phosphatase